MRCESEGHCPHWQIGAPLLVETGTDAGWSGKYRIGGTSQSGRILLVPVEISQVSSSEVAASLRSYDIELIPDDYAMQFGDGQAFWDSHEPRSSDITFSPFIKSISRHSSAKGLGHELRKYAHTFIDGSDLTLFSDTETGANKAHFMGGCSTASTGQKCLICFSGGMPFQLFRAPSRFVDTTELLSHATLSIAEVAGPILVKNAPKNLIFDKLMELGGEQISPGMPTSVIEEFLRFVPPPIPEDFITFLSLCEGFYANKVAYLGIRSRLAIFMKRVIMILLENDETGEYLYVDLDTPWQLMRRTSKGSETCAGTFVDEAIMFLSWDQATIT